MRNIPAVTVDRSSNVSSDETDLGRVLTAKPDFVHDGAPYSFVRIRPFGVGVANDVGKILVYSVDPDKWLGGHNAPAVYHVQLVLTALCTLGTAVGKAGVIPNATDKLCDTVVRTAEASDAFDIQFGGTSSDAYSPADNKQGEVVVKLVGAQLFTIRYQDVGAGGTDPDESNSVLIFY